MLRRKSVKFGAATVSIIAGMIATPSYALPSFAKQTNKACSACHFQNYPMLTDYGRAFKASGFTEIYDEKTREGTDGAALSIPIVLNAAWFGSMRIDRYSGNSTLSDGSGNPSYANFTTITLPEEASLFIGGRVGSHVGFHSETKLRPSAGLSALKLPFWFPLNDSTRVLLVPFAADTHGPSYGFETLNTGASDIHLTFENAGQTSAQAYLGATNTGATGLAAVLWNPKYYLGYTRWAATAGPAGIGSNYAPGTGIQAGKTPGSNYFRGVYFLPTRGWDTAIGVQVISGRGASPFDSTNPPPGPLDAGGNPTFLYYSGPEIDTKYWSIDAQVQGAIGSHLLGVYFTHGEAAASGSNGNLFNPVTTDSTGNIISGKKKTATTLTTSFGLVPGKVNVTAGIMIANNGLDSSKTTMPTSDNAFTFGVLYLFTQNVKFLFETTRVQNPGALDGVFDNNGHQASGIKQKMTGKLFYDF